MDDAHISGRRDNPMFNEMMGLAGGPAYLRRARQVEEALAQLVERCRRQREEWLPMVRLNLGRLASLAGDWSALRPFLATDEHLDQLQQLHAELQPRLRLVIEPTTSRRALRGALAELRVSLERFNDRWRAFLGAVDLTPVNELREGYNRYYLIEKESAVKSARIARQGYQPLPPLTHADLADLLPLLPVPEEKE